MENTYTFGRGCFKTIEQGNELSWMIGNGLGGYADGTLTGGSAMSFHGYLISSFNPPVMRYLVFARVQEEIKCNNTVYDLTSQQYINEHKDGQKYLEKFVFDDIPEFYYRVNDISIKKSVTMDYGHNTTYVCYEIENGMDESNFKMLPLFNYRAAGDVTEKADLKFELNLNQKEGKLKLVPDKNKNISINFQTSDGIFYDRSLKEVTMATPNYIIEENNYYMIDNRTGFLGVDNHYTPYEINVALKPFEKKKIVLRCSTEDFIDSSSVEDSGFKAIKEYKDRDTDLVLKSNLQNDTFASNLVKAADHFIVKRKSTNLKTVLAGFPWFTDWGRDTMISFEGLTLVTKRFDDAKEILESFAKYIKNGLVPNVFPDSNVNPGYNTADASLWYFEAVYKYLCYQNSDKDYQFIKDKIYQKLKEIIHAYKNGTDFSIKMDDQDFLICAGSNLDQITWMDVRVGDLVVTPRHGKPVEINALWYNALKIMEILSHRFENEAESEKYKLLSEKVKKSFNKKFWNEDLKCLYDVVDKNDDSIRPNQLFAVSLPFTMLDKDKEKSIVNICYKHLYSTYGLRSLSCFDKRFRDKYIGKLINRDTAYHMGTTWAYLFGPFIDSYLKVNDYSKDAVDKSYEMCHLFEDHMKDGCINGIAEIFDGSFSSTGRGCYSQAWSVAEVLRAYALVLKYKKN